VTLASSFRVFACSALTTVHWPVNPPGPEFELPV
jgi:hypothetical protein